MKTTQEYLNAASNANFIDAGNILARAIGHNKLVSKLEKNGYQSLALRLIEAVAFRYQESNQSFMKKILTEHA